MKIIGCDINQSVPIKCSSVIDSCLQLSVKQVLRVFVSTTVDSGLGATVYCYIICLALESGKTVLCFLLRFGLVWWAIYVSDKGHP